MEQAYKHIKNREIKDTAVDLGINKYPEGLLLFSNNLEIEKTYLNKPFRSDNVAFLFITKGSLQIKIDEFTYKLSKNHVLLITPGTSKELLHIGKDCQFKCLLITDECYDSFPVNQKAIDYYSYRIKQSHYILKVGHEDLNDMINIFNTIEKFVTKDEKFLSSKLLIAGLSNMLIEHLRHQIDFEQVKDKKTTLVNSFLSLLPQHIYSQRNVNFYAEFLQINPQYLSKTLKAKTGKTALRLIEEMVIKKAEYLLNNPHTSIREVSEKLSFPDPYTFSKYFKQNNGITPSEFRNF